MTNKVTYLPKPNQILWSITLKDNDSHRQDKEMTKSDQLKNASMYKTFE